MNRSLLALAIVALLAAAASAAQFTAKPTVSADGKGFVIKFAVDKPVDVAVSIVNKDGKIVRRLAAGVLGENAPPPLKAGLSQAIAWDGNDDDGKAAPADCKAVVQLGLGAELEKVIGDDRQAIASVNAPAVGPAGELFVYDGGQISVYDREGKYVRQIMPAPATLDASKLAGLDPVKLDDGATLFRKGYPSGKWTGSAVGSMAVSPDGKMLYMAGSPRYARTLTKIGTDGSVPADAFTVRLTTHADNGNLYVAVSPDGKTLYLAGAEAGYMGDDARELSYRQSVYRLKLDSKGPAETFTGDDENSGGDGFSVNDPKGLATDPAGRLYVANHGGNNVAVYTPGAGFLKSFEVKRPREVAVNPKTGQLYVLCGSESHVYKFGYHFPPTQQNARLVVLSKDGKVEKELELPPAYVKSRKDAKSGESTTQPEFNTRMAVDFSDAAKPIVWVGVASPAASYAKWGLLRIEDLGATFGEPKDVCSHDKGTVRGSMGRMALDHDRDILYLCNDGDNLKRYNAADGSLLDPLKVKDASGKNVKLAIYEPAVGPGGTIYFSGTTEGFAKGQGIFRVSPDGVLQPFAAGTPAVGGRTTKGASGDSARGVAVTRTGEMFIMYYDEARPADAAPAEPWDKCLPLPTSVARFAPDGKLIDPRYVRYLRSGSQGLRIDSQGGIYVADNIIPAGQAYPNAIAKVMPDEPLKRDYPARLDDATFDPMLRWIGSVIKFKPEGGRLLGMPEETKCSPVARAENDLYRPAPPNQWFMFNYHNLTLTGAQWQFYGMAPVAAQYQGVTHVERCVCKGGRFDLDPFDRVYVPDTFRGRFTVLDSAGNLITRIGQYGNRDAGGLSLSHAPYVAAGDNYVFFGDSGARRLIKAKLTYAATAEAPIGK